MKLRSINSTNESNQSKTSKSTTSNFNKFRQKNDFVFKIRLFKRESRTFSYSLLTQKNIEIDLSSTQTFSIKSLIIEIDISFAKLNINNSQLLFLNAKTLTNVFRSIIFRFLVFDVINFNKLKNQSFSNDFIFQTNVFRFLSSNNSLTLVKKSNFRFFSVVDNELKNKSFISAAITFNISIKTLIDEIIFRYSVKSMLIALNSTIQIVIKISTNVIIRQIKKMLIN